MIPTRRCRTAGRGRGGGAAAARDEDDGHQPLRLGRAAPVRARRAAGRLPGAPDGRTAQTLTQPFNVLIDPRLAAEGVTAADLKEQFDHNMRMRELVADVNAARRARARGADAARRRDRRRRRQGEAGGRDCREAADRAGALRQARPAGAHHLPRRHDDAASTRRSAATRSSATRC